MKPPEFLLVNINSTNRLLRSVMPLKTNGGTNIRSTANQMLPFMQRNSMDFFVHSKKIPDILSCL